MGTHSVRMWGIREHKGRDRSTGEERSTYRVRWKVAGREFGKSFQTEALAEGFRSRLVAAQREGVAFDEATGLPERYECGDRRRVVGYRYRGPTGEERVFDPADITVILEEGR